MNASIVDEKSGMNGPGAIFGISLVQVMIVLLTVPLIKWRKGENMAGLKLKEKVRTKVLSAQAAIDLLLKTDPIHGPQSRTYRWLLRRGNKSEGG